ncbi:MAG: hypothetical protein BAJALOKI1v1_110037 [Promethearchaeota archaeon]|nr:MAG: hypothetical protein BAJALOKI1v1_110037 [Candidatus Lokiarchaeota archaeon]
MISDNINGTKNWNINESNSPSIATDTDGNVHVVWEDSTNLESCGSDSDIFYANYSLLNGQWSHAKVISDNINGTKNWNINESNKPSIAIDAYGNIHVVWQDSTNLEGCGTDSDIFYINYSIITGQWSDVEVISDNTNGTKNWNTGFSYTPSVTIDGDGNVHIVWEDYTNLEGCGTDMDIFYSSSLIFTSNAHESNLLLLKYFMDSNNEIKQRDLTWIIFLLIGLPVILIGSIFYSFTKRKKEKASIKPKETSAEASKQKKSIKAKKEVKLNLNKLNTSKPIVTMKELEELHKTESEMNIETQKIKCLVHRGSIVGTNIYICPNCQAFYCLKCVKALKKNNERCWACDYELQI